MATAPRVRTADQPTRQHLHDGHLLPQRHHRARHDVSQVGLWHRVELNSSGGTPAVKSAYAGPVKCFNITLTGSSGGNTVRVGFTQSAMPVNQVSPYVEIAPFTNGYSGQVCFTDAECPGYAITAAPAARRSAPRARRSICRSRSRRAARRRRSGAYSVCVSKIEPVLTTTGRRHDQRLQRRHGPGHDSRSSSAPPHVTCSGKDYVVQNNAWARRPDRPSPTASAPSSRSRCRTSSARQQHAGWLSVGVHGLVLGRQHHGQRPAARRESDNRG